MIESEREEKELEYMDELKKINLTECVEDNEQLKRKLQDKIYHIVVLLYLNAY